MIALTIVSSLVALILASVEYSETKSAGVLGAVVLLAGMFVVPSVTSQTRRHSNEIVASVSEFIFIAYGLATLSYSAVAWGYYETPKLTLSAVSFAVGSVAGHYMQPFEERASQRMTLYENNGPSGYRALVESSKQWSALSIVSLIIAAFVVVDVNDVSVNMVLVTVVNLLACVTAVFRYEQVNTFVKSFAHVLVNIVLTVLAVTVTYGYLGHCMAANKHVAQAAVAAGWTTIHTVAQHYII